MAWPSRENSGNETTSKSTLGFACIRSVFRTCSPVLAGTVLFSTMMWYPSIDWAMARVAASM